MVTTDVELASRIGDFVARLLREVPVEAVILYGSYASNDARDDSDIDLAVISSDFENQSPWERQETIARSTLGRGYRLSPIGFASSEYHNPGPHSFLGEIIRTGRVVYPRPE